FPRGRPAAVAATPSPGSPPCAGRVIGAGRSGGAGPGSGGTPSAIGPGPRRRTDRPSGWRADRARGVPAVRAGLRRRSRTGARFGTGRRVGIPRPGGALGRPPGTSSPERNGAPMNSTGSDPLHYTDAVELARMLRGREVSAREVVQAHLDRIHTVDPLVNAVVTRWAERAMEEAAAADERLARGASPGPLHGLPVAVKDVHDTAGLRTTHGSPIFAEHVPGADA